MNWLIEVIADNVFGYLLDQSGASEKLRTALRGDPIETAFQRALQTAFEQFERRYPQWASALFDQHFFEHAALPSWLNSSYAMGNQTHKRWSVVGSLPWG